MINARFPSQTKLGHDTAERDKLSQQLSSTCEPTYNTKQPLNKQAFLKLYNSLSRISAEREYSHHHLECATTKQGSTLSLAQI